MHSYLDDMQREIKETADRFSREVLAPSYMDRERSEKVIDRTILRQMAELGFVAPTTPTEFGGLGLDCVTSGVICESMAHGDFNYSYIPLTTSIATDILGTHAQPAVRDQWIARVLAGEALIGVALTEPRGGSDAANLVMKAERCAGGWKLNGEKTSATMADQADAFIVMARSGTAEDGARGVSAFLVPADLPGISRTRFNDLGSIVIGRGSLFFDDVFVPDDHLLGGEGTGFIQIMQGFDYTRPLLGLQCVGAAQASVDETWRYMTEREAFGQPISAFQGVTFPIAEGDTMLSAIRALCYQTLKLRDDGAPHTAEAAMCKWLGPKAAVDVIHQCLLTHGHYGWSKDLPHQQRMRDVMGIEIGDGTAQIMKMIIARTRLKAV